MANALAEANVGRSYSLAATCIAIFTFTLFFLYPRFLNGEAHALLFQISIVVLGVATFSFVFASFYYYYASVGNNIDEAESSIYSRRGDRCWLLGCLLLLLDPSLILFTIGLRIVGSVWLSLWFFYLLFLFRHFPKVQTSKPKV